MTDFYGIFIEGDGGSLPGRWLLKADATVVHYPDPSVAAAHLRNLKDDQTWDSILENGASVRLMPAV